MAAASRGRPCQWRLAARNLRLRQERSRSANAPSVLLRITSKVSQMQHILIEINSHDLLKEPSLSSFEIILQSSDHIGDEIVEAPANAV